MRQEAGGHFSSTSRQEKLVKVVLDTGIQGKVEAILVEFSSTGARVKVNLYLQPGTDVSLILGDGNLIPAKVSWRNAGEFGLSFGNNAKTNATPFVKHTVPEGMYRKNGRFKAFDRFENSNSAYRPRLKK